MALQCIYLIPRQPGPEQIHDPEYPPWLSQAVVVVEESKLGTDPIHSPLLHLTEYGPTPPLILFC